MPSVRMNHEVLPGELTTFRAVGATGFGLGAIGGLALWLTQPGAIHSDPVAVLTTVLCAALALAMALVLRAARKQAREYAVQVRKLALVDQLTGALNRRGFETRANAELSRARRHDEEVTLIYRDLDGFKQVNDNLGHAAGDVVLRRAAISMGATLRGEDVLARVGGDEFVALLGSPPPTTRTRSPTG